MTVHIVREKISREKLQKIADERFGDLVKGVVDIGQGILALGAELHADAQAELMEKEGSRNEETWGINLWPAKQGDGFVEFDSVVNLKPAFGNRSRDVEDEHIREQIRDIVHKLISD